MLLHQRIGLGMAVWLVLYVTLFISTERRHGNKEAVKNASGSCVLALLIAIAIILLIP